VRYVLLMTVLVLAAMQPQSAPKEEREAFQAALAQYEAARWDAAAEAFRTVAEQGGPGATAAGLDLGLALYHGERFKEAREAFRSLAGRQEVVVRAQAAFNAGNCEWRLGDKALAAELYRNAQRLAAEGLQQIGGDPSVPRRQAQEAELLIELHRRATFNMAIAAKADEQPHPETAAVSPETPAPETGAGESSPETASAPASEGTAAPAAGGNTALPGHPAAGEALRGVLLRDSGPVVKHPGGTAPSDEPDW